MRERNLGIRRQLICAPNNNNNNNYVVSPTNHRRGDDIIIEKRKYELKSWPSFYAGWKRRDLCTRRGFDGKFLLEVFARWWHASYLRIPDSWPPTSKDRLAWRGARYFFDDEMEKRFGEKNSRNELFGTALFDTFKRIIPHDFMEASIS